MLCQTDMKGLSIKASIRSNFSDLEVKFARSQPCVCFNQDHSNCELKFHKIATKKM